ncbi:MAG: mobilization protein MobD [Oleibacter sp.]|nr:mobilization protein MobD [Thalassolituus sp.]
MSTIHFVGGEKGGVGKSVMSRLLSQYCIDTQKVYVGFDADQSHGTLTRFYPEFTQSLDISVYEDADKIFEAAVIEDVNVVVDLPAQSERFLTHWMEENDIADMFEEAEIRCIYWYVVDDGLDSANLVANFLTKYGKQLPIVLVKNHGRGQDFSALDKVLGQKNLHATEQIELPELYASTMSNIDHLNINFWAAANQTERPGGVLGLMERQRTRVWIKKAYSQIEGIIEKS